MEEGKGRRVVESILNIHVYPFIGDKTLDKITSRDLMACLDSIWFEKRVTAIKAFKQIRAVMGWAMGREYIERDPSKYVRDGLGPNPPTTVHMPSQHHSLIGETLKIIEGSKAHWATKAAVRFLALTANRPGAVRRARWDEIDLAKAIWTIPANRAKNREAFKVPLSRPSPFGASQGPRTHGRCGTGVSLTPGTADFRLDDEQALPREPGWLRPVRYSQHLQGMVRGSGGAPPGCGGLYGTHLRWSPARSGPCGAQASGDGGLGATSIPTCSPPVRCRPLASDQPKNRAEPSINPSAIAEGTALKSPPAHPPGKTLMANKTRQPLDHAPPAPTTLHSTPEPSFGPFATTTRTRPFGFVCPS